MTISIESPKYITIFLRIFGIFYKTISKEIWYYVAVGRVGSCA